MDTSPNSHAQHLFDGIAAWYDLPAELFSFFQYGQWRRFLLARLGPGPGDLMLDLCTGTAGVAMAATRRYGGRVVGVDLSPQMIRRARREVQRRGLTQQVPLLLGRAESLPFPDCSFDTVCFTFLLRYVQQPEATLAEVARVLKPGGRLASLEFGVPEGAITGGLWRLYTHGILPLLAWPVSHGWRRVGAFLGPSISQFSQAHPVASLRHMWEGAGMEDVHAQGLSLGGALVMWGTKTMQATEDSQRSRWAVTEVEDEDRSETGLLRERGRNVA